MRKNSRILRIFKMRKMRILELCCHPTLSANHLADKTKHTYNQQH